VDRFNNCHGTGAIKAQAQAVAVRQMAVVGEQIGELFLKPATGSAATSPTALPGAKLAGA